MTTFGDQVKQYGGAPVGSPRNFEGWWGADTYFIDYDNGTTGVNGKNIDRPQKHLRLALNAASAGDTIYIRPRDFSSEDPQAITPDTAANWTIATADHEVSIIGTGKGTGHPASHMTHLQTYSALTTPVITIHSPGCVIENIRISRTSSTSGLIYSINNGTYDGGNTTIINNDLHDADTNGAIKLDACWQMSIVGNRFVNCDIGLYITGYYSTPQIYQVCHNKFTVTSTEVGADVYADSAGVKRFLAYDNYHAADQPALGTHDKYYIFAGTSTGAIFNCFFGTNVVTEGTAFTLSNVRQAGNYCMNGLMT